MKGKLVGGFIVFVALATGIAVYWLQEYAYYHEAAFNPGAEILLTPIESDQPEVILAQNVQGIDAESSPLRFRACFETPLTQGMLTETYRAYEGAEPLNAPSWFDCFDAAAIGAALESGEALAFLSQEGIAPDVDRVVAVFADGRAYAWQQFRPGALEGN
ncbi:MAG: hypothetical protein RIT52_1498 [Pseudomonadota bacterium]|jgi:Family of unknown function (DUF6446)